MRRKIAILGAVSLLVFCGCEENEYTIHMTCDGDVVTRKVIISENMPPGVHARLGRLYSRQTDENTYEGSFTEELPDDVGGFGRYVHLSNAMGDVYIYVERFRGDDARALDIEKAFDATDRLVDLTIDWMETELGDNPNFERLKTFGNEQLKEDIKNLLVYMWMASWIRGSSEDDAAVRAMLYLYERDYFTIDDIGSLAASTNRQAWMLQFFRGFVAKKLGYCGAEEIAEELKFLQDPYAALQSASRFLTSPETHDRLLREARARSGDPNLIIDPNLISDCNDTLVEQLLDLYGIDLETFLIDFDLFASLDKVNVRLDCPRKPYETNGQWDGDAGQVSWSSRITDDEQPFMCHASVGQPNRAFQKEHFGKVMLADEALVRYSLWYKGLSDEQRGQWDQFLGTVDPNDDIPNKLGSFRFKNAPPASPGSDGVIRLLSDLPRELIIEGLKMKKKDYQESDSQEPAPARKSSFTVHAIGKVVRKGGKTFLELDKKYEAGLKGLEKHSYVHVVYWFDRNDTPEKRAVLQVHPRGDKTNPLTGVFATHSPFRPNLIAISRCDIVSVEGSVIEIKGIDALDGSPILDLKGDFFTFHRPNTQ